METEEEKKARKKAAQAEAHRKWRLSDKGKAYYAKKRAGIPQGEQAGQEVQDQRAQAGEVASK